MIGNGKWFKEYMANGGEQNSYFEKDTRTFQKEKSTLSRLIGISRSAAAEFSFFMGIPAMAGASLIKAYGFLDYVTEANISVPFSAYAILLCAAAAVAFIVSMVAIKFLMDFVKKHSFAPFGVYRIILGALVIGWFLIR